MMNFKKFIHEMTRDSEKDAIKRMESHMDNVADHVGYYHSSKEPSTSWIREISTFLNNAYKEYENTPNGKPIKQSKIDHQANTVPSIIMRNAKIKKLKVHDNFNANDVKIKVDKFIKNAHATMRSNYGTGFSFDDEWVKNNLNGE